jgi:nifR3 family TIM-barrel protein
MLAPMSGVTHSAFRRLIKSENPGAVGLLTTEFVSVEGLTRLNRRTRNLLDFKAQEQPLAVQIFGHDVDRIAEAAMVVQSIGAVALDLNCGCPAPKVVRKGGGCELMRHPAHLRLILERLVRAVQIPVTIKMRSGWDASSINAVEIALLAEDCGVQMVTVHGRTRTQQYRGLADLNVVAEVVEAVNIPVVGSGDIVDIASAQAYFDLGVSGIMIGRGALANPWLFSEIRAWQSGQVFEPIAPIEVARILERYLAMIQVDFPQKAILGFMKQIASRITKSVPGAKAARQELCRAPTIEDFLSVLDRWKIRWSSSAEKVFEVVEPEVRCNA